MTQKAAIPPQEHAAVERRIEALEMQLRQPLDSQVPRRLLVEQWRIVLNELADLHVLRDS